MVGTDLNDSKICRRDLILKLVMFFMLEHSKVFRVDSKYFGHSMLWCIPFFWVQISNQFSFLAVVRKKSQQKGFTDLAFEIYFKIALAFAINV